MIETILGVTLVAAVAVLAVRHDVVRRHGKVFDDQRTLADKLRERGERILLGPVLVVNGVGNAGRKGLLVLTERRLAFFPSQGFDDDIRLSDVRDVREDRIVSWRTKPFIVDVGDGRPRTFFTNDRTTWMRVIRTAAAEAKAGR